MTKSKVKFMRVFTDFYDYLSPNEVFLLSYLLDIRAIVKKNKAGYYRISASFLQARTEWTIPTVKKYLLKLAEGGYIKMHHENEANTKTPWWIEFCYDKINEMLIDYNTGDVGCDFFADQEDEEETSNDTHNRTYY